MQIVTIFTFSTLVAVSVIAAPMPSLNACIIEPNGHCYGSGKAPPNGPVVSKREAEPSSIDTIISSIAMEKRDPALNACIIQPNGYCYGEGPVTPKGPVVNKRDPIVQGMSNRSMLELYCITRKDLTRYAIE